MLNELHLELKIQSQWEKNLRSLRANPWERLILAAKMLYEMKLIILPVS